MAGDGYGPKTHNWTGFYVGGTLGYGWGQSTHCDGPTCTGGTPDYPSPKPEGVNGGVTLGYNLQVQSVVLGVEADYALANMRAVVPSTTTYGCGSGCETSILGFGTVRGRVGVAFDRYLPYFTAGIAYSEVRGGLAPAGSRTVFSPSATIGGGLEIALTKHLSTKFEYLHVYSIDEFRFALGCVGPGCGVKDVNYDVGRIGLNYRF